MKIVYLKWVDITCPGSTWVAEGDDDLITDCVSMTIESIGYLFKETENDVIISTSLASDGSILRPVVIPKAVIKRMVVVPADALSSVVDST